MTDKDFFIGWASDMPEGDRRFFLKAGLSGLVLTAGLASAAAGFQNAPGRGSWNPSNIRTWTGIVTAEPYAMLRTTDLDGMPKTVLLACLGKCGVAARIGALDGQMVEVQGSLIQRGANAMLAVIDGMDWIKPSEAPLDPSLAFPEPEPISEITLQGEILDSKCWFGAMRPSEGKVHKSCAALCIRGGLPPAFFAQDKSRNRAALLIMTHQGGAHGDDLLPLVADPVQISGQAKRWGNLLLLDAPVSAISRL